MCGIVGIVELGGQPVDEELVVRMCETMTHRGPDDQGIVRLPSAQAMVNGRARATLGSRRLAIIDRLGGRQPIGNEDGTVWAALNGEIYNFQELRDALRQRGHRFSTGADTEVIVHLYEERGEGFVDELDGMFALAVWDDRRQRLILARDRAGKKPLLYAESHGRLVFASEFEAILSDPSVPRTLDPEALDYYLTYMAIPSPWSIYRAIRKLPAAHLLVYDRGGLRLSRYWSLSYAPKLELGEEEAAEHLLGLLTEAVRKRLVGDVPVGAFLSGGVDSSAVVALMARCCGRPVQTFSIGFEEEAYNELPFARRLAWSLDCDHHELIVRPKAVEVLPLLARRFGEPFADSSAIPTYYLARLTSRAVTVALSGDGGDEMFAGYGRHLGNRLAEAWRQSPALVRRPSEWLGHRFGGTRWLGRWRRFVRSAALGRADRYRLWAGVFTGRHKTGLTAAVDGAPAERGLVEELFQRAEALDAVDAMLMVDTAFYLPTDLLVKTDIASMANSLEVRAPFLDYRLMEFAARLPSRMKLRGLTGKYLLKRAMEGIVPSEPLHRRKRGFAVPVSRWLRAELRGFLSEHLVPSHAARQGLLRQEMLKGLVDEHVEGRADHAQQLWTLLAFELWYRAFME